jgi:hypothetical protein
VQGFQVLRVLEPALRMKAQSLTAEVGKILFVENLVGEKEKRKTAYWRMQGDPETIDPVGQGREWVL